MGSRVCRPFPHIADTDRPQTQIELQFRVQGEGHLTRFPTPHRSTAIQLPFSSRGGGFGWPGAGRGRCTQDSGKSGRFQ